MTKQLGLFLLLLTAPAYSQNIEGQIVAAQYGVFQVVGYSDETSTTGFVFPDGACQVSGGGRNFVGVTTGVPIKIVDGDPLHTEIATPSAVNVSGCTVTVTTTYNHQLPYFLTSGTGGLQEAINANGTGQGANTIILNSDWYALVPPGIAATVIGSVKGNTSVGLVDVTTTPYTYYSWNGSAYASTGGRGGSADTRPRATTSVVEDVVAASGSCVLSISPATAGQQTVSACNTGSPSGPGTITGIHLTLGPNGDNANILQNSTLSFACDGETRTAPIGTFLLAQDNPTPFSNDWFAGNLGSQSRFSANRRMELNFTSGCTVTFTNASPTATVTLFGEVDYRLGTNVSRSSRQYWHAYSVPSTSVTHFTNLQLLPTVTDLAGGELESITLWTNSGTNGSTLEGYTTVTTDGNAAVQANGTEDFFGSGYYGVNSAGGHASPKWGEFYASGLASEFSGTTSLSNAAATFDALLYRNFSTDDRENALFKQTIGALQPNGEASKPNAGDPGTVHMASLVTFWSHDPMAGSPTFSPLAA